MKRLLIALSIFLLSTTLVAQTSNSNVFWSMRIKVKLDKIGEFEKRLPVFIKTHYPTMSFRVYETITGPHTGSYVIISGPYAFKDFDISLTSPKGEAVQKADMLALTSLYESYEVQHSRQVTDISIPNPNRDLKYLVVTERKIENGKWPETLVFLKKLREAREKAGAKSDYSYFRPVAGGNQNTFITVRYITKWEEIDMTENLAEMYDNAFGRAAWAKDLEMINQFTTEVKQEMRVLRKDLSATAVK
jgi:hypothetical protein